MSTEPRQEMTTLRAYHGDPAIKAKYVARFAAHRAADEVIQRQGFVQGRGCFVGCTLDAYEHSRFPVELGWPEWLAYLADHIFETLPKAEAPKFGTAILDAPRVGADLEPVRNQFLLLLQRRNLARLGGNSEPYAQGCREAIQGVINWLDGTVAGSAARSARSVYSAAQSAARSAFSAAQSAHSEAYSAARSAYSAAQSAHSAAYSAAESAYSAAQSAHSAARSAAQSAAHSAAYSAANSAARSAEARTQRDELIALLTAAAAPDTP